MKSLSVLQTAEVENGANRLDRAAFAADQSAEIVGCDTHTEFDGLSSVRMLGDLDSVSITDQRFHNFLDCFFH
jgi:hypothetical protein